MIKIGLIEVACKDALWSLVAMLFVLLFVRLIYFSGYMCGEGMV